MTKPHPLSQDLDYILESTRPLWHELQNQRIFITGGTGFFGKWLLESFAWINAKLNLKAHAVILTRNPDAFAKQCPHLFNQSCFTFHAGDIKNFQFPEGHFSHVIHAATDASAALNENDPLRMLDTIVEGTRQTLEFAKTCGATKFLLTSSGAIYGRQPPELSHISEEHPCQPNFYDAKSAYAIGKGMAEHLCYWYGKQFGIDIKIARCFAFVGPYLPLDIHFAIGNFIRDGLHGNNITIHGDGTPYRSYLYAADLAVWLWMILFKGKPITPYNVGSDEAYSIAEIAQCVATVFEPTIKVNILKQPDNKKLPERYIPATKLAQTELGLSQTKNLKESIRATIDWHLQNIGQARRRPDKINMEKFL